MTKPYLLPRLLCLLVVASLLSNQRSRGSESLQGSRPNIVIFLCDDLGYADLECYGHPSIKTPNINRLADEGVRCTDFYSAAPVCSPSRVGLLTGRSPNKAGVYDWIPSASKPRSDLRHLVHMRRNEQTIPALLRSAGYRTCLAGKWHCNSRFNKPSQPQPGDFGFEHWLATQNNAAPSHAFPKNFVRNGKSVGPTQEFSCQYVVSEAISWLDKLPRDDKFFLYIPFHEPHEPVASPDELIERYLPESRNRDEAQFFANVANVDLAVGRLVEALERRGVRDETLIIFTSDNGPETLNRYKRANRSYGRAKPLKGMKLHTTDAGFRVAGILNWPRKINPGQQLETPLSALDLLPTLCELAGCQPAAEIELDGQSCLPVLTGKNWERSKPLIWAYYNAINEARVAMRYRNWKVLARLHNNGPVGKFENIHSGNQAQIGNAKLTQFEIYDVIQDIGETNNLANRPELSHLKSKLRAEYQQLLSASYIWKE